MKNNAPDTLFSVFILKFEIFVSKATTCTVGKHLL